MIGIIGSGLMGKGIAIELAAHHHEVLLVSAERKLSLTDLQLEIEKITSKAGYSIETVNHNLIVLTDENQLLSCNLIIEAMVEDLVKKRLQLNNYKKFINEDATLCSNTSSLSIEDIFKDIFPLNRVFGVHFFNPVNVMNLVELSYLDQSHEAKIKELEVLITSIGKKVIKVKNSQGYIVNRVLIPMINEAAKLLDEEVASAEDIDQAMKLGANHPIGPLKLSDLVGNDVVLAILQNITNKNSNYDIAESLKAKVKNNHLGRKTKKGFYDYK